MCVKPGFEVTEASRIVELFTHLTYSAEQSDRATCFHKSTENNMVKEKAQKGLSHSLRDLVFISESKKVSTRRSTHISAESKQCTGVFCHSGRDENA